MKKLLFFIVFVMVFVVSNAQDINEIKLKADKGDAEAQYLMGYNYSHGLDGLAKDYSKSILWFEKAAHNGNGAAAYFLGFYNYYGIGTNVNTDEALSWFTKALKSGYSEAQSMIAECKRNSKYRNSLASVYKSDGQAVEIDDFDPSTPPLLELVSNSVQFIDPNKNNAIDAGEECVIELDVINRGSGYARNCVASVLSADVNKGLILKPKPIKAIAPGEKQSVSLVVGGDLTLETGKVDLVLQINEPHGLGSSPINISISTKHFEEPYLQIVDYAITSITGNKLIKKHPFDMQILLQNLKYGTAEDVVVDLIVPNGVLITSKGGSSKKYSNLSGGATKSLDYSLIVTDNYRGSTIPIGINVHEKYGKYAESKHFDLQINQTLATNKIEVQEKAEEPKTFVIETASLTSNVDKNIPEMKNNQSENYFAVIIANESYNKEAGVPFAANDGKIFAEYCRKTLGLPDTNVRLVTNATLNDMKHEIGWLKKVIESRKGDAKVIFYYAGHGIPDEKDRQSYLLPIDGYGSDVSTGYSLNSLYKELGEFPAKSVVVLLDACFSGAKREGDMLASARGVALKVSRGEPVGNMVVFSAAQSDETAYPYKEEGHGLFTYYLLKKIQETKGEVSLKSLGDYLQEKVGQKSIVVNGKSQTPTVLVSDQIINEWSSWKLK